MNFKFDKSLSVGDVISFLGLIAAATVLYSRLAVIETKLDPLWQEFLQRAAKTATTYNAPR
jgi:hypothetical protein